MQYYVVLKACKNKNIDLFVLDPWVIDEITNYGNTEINKTRLEEKITELENKLRSIFRETKAKILAKFELLLDTHSYEKMLSEEGYKAKENVLMTLENEINDLDPDTDYSPLEIALTLSKLYIISSLLEDGHEIKIEES